MVALAVVSWLLVNFDAIELAEYGRYIELKHTGWKFRW